MMARSDLLHARAGYRSARPTTVLKIQLATHGRSIQRVKTTDRGSGGISGPGILSMGITKEGRIGIAATKELPGA